MILPLDNVLLLRRELNVLYVFNVLLRCHSAALFLRLLIILTQRLQYLRTSRFLLCNLLFGLNVLIGDTGLISLKTVANGVILILKLS